MTNQERTAELEATLAEPTPTASMAPTACAPTAGLDWMATRAYDPTIGRFISRDPLDRAPLYLADNPCVYAGNNPLSNIDPSGQ